MAFRDFAVGTVSITGLQAGFLFLLFQHSFPFHHSQTNVLDKRFSVQKGGWCLWQGQSHDL
jgi:hypothetical protein